MSEEIRKNFIEYVRRLNFNAENGRIYFSDRDGARDVTFTEPRKGFEILALLLAMQKTILELDSAILESVKSVVGVEK